MKLLFNHDAEVAAWAHVVHGAFAVNYIAAIGVLNEDNTLVGAALFQEYNGSNVEISYYGPQTLRSGIVKRLARVAVDDLGVHRITARSRKSNKTMTGGIKKLGFVYEGIQRKFYGDEDAVLYGLYGTNLAKLAGKEMH